MSERKILNAENLLSLVRLVVAAIAVTATVLVFYFTKESKQDDWIRGTDKSLVETTTILSQHVKRADETFGKIDRTMLEQRGINEKTSNALTEVSTVQRSIKEENGRLADTIEKQAEEVRKLANEVRRNNGHTP